MNLSQPTLDRMPLVANPQPIPLAYLICFRRMLTACQSSGLRLGEGFPLGMRGLRVCESGVAATDLPAMESQMPG